MRILRFIVRRVLFALPQVFGITVVTFFLIRLLPGNPAALLAGQYANPSSIKPYCELTCNILEDVLDDGHLQRDK